MAILLVFLAAKEKGNNILEFKNLSKYRERFKLVGQLAQRHTQFGERVSSSGGCSSVNGHFSCFFNNLILIVLKKISPINIPEKISRNIGV